MLMRSLGLKMILRVCLGTFLGEKVRSTEYNWHLWNAIVNENFAEADLAHRNFGKERHSSAKKLSTEEFEKKSYFGTQNIELRRNFCLDGLQLFQT